MSLVTLRMGWRNLGRNMKRTLLAIGAIALGQLTLIVVNSLMEGFFQDILETVTAPWSAIFKSSIPIGTTSARWISTLTASPKRAAP
jgi:hypothetical protein